jgi:flotillin
VWENGGGNGRSNTADFLHKMAGTLPPMLNVMRDIGGIEVPESLAKLTGETDAKSNGATHASATEVNGDEEPSIATTVKPRG